MKLSLPTSRIHGHGFRARFTLVILLTWFLALPAGRAQINTGSDGHDGVFNPTQSVVVNMADHPDGIYQYASVNVPSGVTVTFKPNAANSPVVWLVQGAVTINGNVDVSGAPSTNGSDGGANGPGGYGGGAAGAGGLGPGGGNSSGSRSAGGNASFATTGTQIDGQAAPGVEYGNAYLLPFIGGSGGAGSSRPGSAGAGGGGAILIAAPNDLTVNGQILAQGGIANYGGTGAGSGGAIRLVANRILGYGNITARGGGCPWIGFGNGGDGRIRFDDFQNDYSGSLNAQFTQGFQPIILPASGQGIQLNIASVGSLAVGANPGGVLGNPDLTIPGQINNPITVVVKCTNVPMNTAITVIVHPANGMDVQAVGLNTVGTSAASTATVSLSLPRGGGIIYAACVSGVTGGTSSMPSASTKALPPLAETGWTATGERFKAVEVTSPVGGKQKTTYVTESGKRYAAPSK